MVRAWSRPRRYRSPGLYELAPVGRALWPALYALRTWGEQYAPGNGGPRRVFSHDACGEPLDHTAYCKTCGAIPEPDHVFVSPVGEPGPDARRDPVAIGLRRPHRLLNVLPAPESVA
jgi:hypothetical protein